MTDAALPALLSFAFLPCLLVLAVAGFAHGMFGFGFAMIATPLLALLVDYRLAIALAALPLFVIASCFLFTHRRTMRSETLTRALVPTVALGSVCGAFLQTALPPYLAFALLALLLAASAVLPAWLNKRQANAPVSGARPTGALGVLAGVTEAAMNVGAPFILLYGGLARLSRLQQLLALNLCFAVGKLIQIAILTQTTSSALPWPHLGVAAATALLGQTAGDRFAGRFSESAFRRLFTCFLGAMALFMLCRAMFELTAHG